MKRLLIVGGLLVVLFACAANIASENENPYETTPAELADREEERQAEKAVPSGPDQSGVFKIKVTSTGSRSGSITYVQPDGGFNMSQDNSAKFPWTKKWTNVDDVEIGWNMNAQQDGGGTITCTVMLDGEVISQNSSKGNYAVVTCAP